MIVLRRVLGFALAGTGVWLLSVLGRSVENYGTGKRNYSQLVWSFTFVARRAKAQNCLGKRLFLTVLAVLAPQIPTQPINKPRRHEQRNSGGHLAPVHEKAILDARCGRPFRGRPLEWCITCNNKRLVLSDSLIVERLKEENISRCRQTDAARRADIHYLARFGRYIPFNVAYGPGAPRVTLPEILSKGGCWPLDEAKETDI